MDDFCDELVERMFNDFEAETMRRGIPASQMHVEGDRLASFLVEALNTRLDCYKADAEQ